MFLARWIALIRVAAAWLAGINHMPFKQFFLWNAFGGITWGITFGLVGYFGGTAGAHLLSKLGVIGAVVLAVMVVGGLLLLRRHERRVELELKAEAGIEPELLEGDPAQGSDADAGAGPAPQPSDAGSSSSAQELMQ